MDTASILIGTVLLLIFTGPVLYIIWLQYNKNKDSLKILRKISTENNMTLNDFEISNSLLLGLDSNSKKLIIVQPLNNMKYDIVDLSEIKSSRISRKTITIPPLSGTREKLLHVGLELSGKNDEPKIAEITFYDEDDNESRDAETKLLLAQRWEKLIKAIS